MLRRRLVRALTVLLMIIASGSTAVRAASADTTYWPSPHNGQRVYLSRACHDRGTGACQANYGCDDMNENSRSRVLANEALGDGAILENGLLDRQYPVRIGDGLTSQNIAASNGWNAKMHIPLHSNAAGSARCDSPVSSTAYGGTQPQYRGANSKELGGQLKYAIQNVSPGTNDQLIYRTDLGELNQTDAVTGYLESEYHTWSKGVTFLRDSNDWAWRIAYGIERCRGYPRSGQGTTSTKHCTW